MDSSSSVSIAAGLLPVLFFVSVGFLRSAQGADNPRAVIDAFVAWAVTSYVSAELLGHFRAITFGPVLILWITLLGIVLGQLWKLRSSFNYRVRLAVHAAFPIVAVIAIVTLFIAM